jgi:hypothetical protein
MAEYEIGVHGHSDDLIEITGDVREELYANYGEPTHVMVGDTEIVAEYDGEWHFSVVDEGENDRTAWFSVGRKKVIEMANDYTEAISVETDSLEVSKIE